MKVVERHDRAVALGLAIFLLAVYLATFSGRFSSIDELSLFAATESLVHTGRLQTPLIAFAKYHNFINAFEPGYSILAAPLYWLARQFSDVSNIHGVLLLNPLLTAANAALLYLFGRWLGYESAAGLAVAFAFGLASMAWPYTKTFLREPTVGLLWTVCLWGLASFADEPTWRAGALTVVPALLAVGVKASSLAAFPVLFGVMAWVLYRSRRVSWQWLALGGTAIIILAGASALMVFTQRGYSLSALVGGFLANPFTVEGLTPWYGLLISPGKGLFVYSPILLLSLIAWPRFYRSRSLLALGSLLLMLSLLAALRATGWWGGQSWGPRYLLPVIPVITLPMIELFAGKRWAWAALGLAIVVQALIATSDWGVGYADVLGRYPNPDVTVGLDWTRWPETPVFNLLSRWGRASVDMVWLHSGLANEIKLDGLLGAGLAFVIGLSGAALIAILRRIRIRAALTLSAVGVAAAIAALLGRAYWNLSDDPAMSAERARQLAQTLSTSPYSPEQIVNISTDFAVHPWMGLLKGPARAAWLSPVEESGFDPLLPTEPDARLAVAVDVAHLHEHRGNHLLNWLNDRAYRFGSAWQGNYQLFYYAVGPNTGLTTSADLRWPNGFTLTGFAAPAVVQRGTALPIDLTLSCAYDPCDGSARIFTNLVSSNGVVLSGHDGPIRYSALPLDLSPGQSLPDKRGVWIPHDAPAGEYELVMGFVDDQGFIPVTLPSEETADYATLARVSVR